MELFDKKIDDTAYVLYIICLATLMSTLMLDILTLTLTQKTLGRCLEMALAISCSN